jgi:hypothetical protein
VYKSITVNSQDLHGLLDTPTQGTSAVNSNYLSTKTGFIGDTSVVTGVPTQNLQLDLVGASTRGAIVTVVVNGTKSGGAFEVIFQYYKKSDGTFYGVAKGDYGVAAIAAETISSTSGVLSISYITCTATVYSANILQFSFSGTYDTITANGSGIVTG